MNPQDQTNSKSKSINTLKEEEINGEQILGGGKYQVILPELSKEGDITIDGNGTATGDLISKAMHAEENELGL